MIKKEWIHKIVKEQKTHQLFYKKSAAMVGEKAKIALVVTAYFVVSISMVLMNKFLLSKQGSNSVPFFVTWFDYCRYIKI